MPEEGNVQYDTYITLVTQTILENVTRPLVHKWEPQKTNNYSYLFYL